MLKFDTVVFFPYHDLAHIPDSRIPSRCWLDDLPVTVYLDRCWVRAVPWMNPSDARYLAHRLFGRANVPVLTRDQFLSFEHPEAVLAVAPAVVNPSAERCLQVIWRPVSELYPYRLAVKPGERVGRF